MPTRLKYLVLLLALLPLQIGAQVTGIKLLDPPFSYRPVNRSFWEEVTEGLNDKKYDFIARLADQRSAKTKEDSLEQAEANLALAQALSFENLTFAATTIYSELIKTKQGTQTAIQSLLEIEKLMQTVPVDEEGLVRELVLDIDYDKPSKELQGFISYQNAMFNKYNGFNSFAENDFKRIPADSYWDFKLRYLQAIDELRKDKLDSSIEKFLTIVNSTLAPALIRRDANHQYARLIFEKGDYDLSYATLRQIDLDPRERGQILLERAWAKYYRKDYSKALGLLTALEAPAFDPSRSPEAYILKMLIYKELCYYDAAFEVFGEFKKRFTASITAIKKRQDLRKDQMLVNMTVIDRELGSKVNFLNLLRDERKRIQEKFSGLRRFAKIRQAYDLKIKEILDQINFQLSNKVRVKADELLDWQEQISFLDYQARVDSLRVTRPRDEVIYKSESIPLIKFDKVYWLFTGEFWLDELEDLKVFAESQCNKSAGSTP